jgi:hypothetical protein
MRGSRVAAAPSKVGKQGSEGNGVLVAVWLNRKGYTNKRTVPTTEKNRQRMSMNARTANPKFTFESFSAHGQNEGAHGQTR